MIDSTAAVASQRGTREYNYEGMFLLDSGRYAGDHEGAVNQLIGMLEKIGATIELHRPWQDGKLAYEIDGHRRGVHYLVFFRMPGKSMTDLNRAVHLSDLVLRHLVLKHDRRIYEASVHALTPGNEQEADAGDGPSREGEGRPRRDAAE